MTEAQIQESAIPGGKLHCIHFKGLMHLPKKIVFSETCKRDPSFSLVIDQVHKAIATKEFKLKVADSEKEVQNDFDKYKVDKGDRSRPWSHLCIAVAHETDYNTTEKFMGRDHKHLVRTTEKILQEWSSVDHMYSCPRSWRSEFPYWWMASCRIIGGWRKWLVPLSGCSSECWGGFRTAVGCKGVSSH